MLYIIKKYLKILLFILKIDWLDTLRINLCHLPLSKGIRFPILLFHARLKIARSANLKISLPKEQCVFGMIKLGCNYSNNVISPIGIKICLGQNAKLVFEGSAVVGNGSSIEVRQGGKICIGKNFGNTGTLTMCSDCEINIGENVSCSWDVSIFDTDLHSYTDGQTMLSLPHMRSVTVGNYSWICQKCTLLKGAALPDWSVLGACSLLTKNYLSFDSKMLSNLFVGNPAKPVNKMIRRDDLYRISKHPNWMITSGFRIINKISN